MNKVCVVVGVGPGNGAAIAAQFANAGYHLALLARSPGLIQQLAAEYPHAHAYECDVSEQSVIQEVFEKIKQDLGDIDTIVYNAGSGNWGTIEEINADQFEANWRVNTLGLFLVSQQVIPAMKKNHHGNIIIIGATASKRGGAKTTAFAAAKAAQRSLAESMAKHLWPCGIHVGLIMIDGVVDLESTRKQMPDKPDDFFVKPEEVALMVYGFTQQPKSTWTFEVEVRPFAEKW